MKNDFGKNFNKKVSNFEKKFSKYAISNLSLYLIMGYAFGYIIRMVDSGLLDWLTLDPMMILRGQIWRLVTWIVVPPTSQNVLFTIITLYFYYSIGSTLEHVWGTYRYNCYLFSGMLFTILGSFVLYGVFAAMGSGNVSFGALFSTYYVNIPCFCGDFSGYAGFADVCNSGKSKIYGNYLWGVSGVRMSYGWTD